MRYTRLVVKLFILITIISVTKCEISKNEKVVLVSPVLAPYRNARAQTNETAKDFPLLMLLASDDKDAETNGAEIGENYEVPQPVYVKKLEDQRPLLRRRRKTSRIYFIHKY